MKTALAALLVLASAALGSAVDIREGGIHEGAIHEGEVHEGAIHEGEVHGGHPAAAHEGIDWNRLNDALNVDNDALNQQRNVVNLLDKASRDLEWARGTAIDHLHADHVAAIDAQRQAIARLEETANRLRQARF
ncbi:hypothetical protein H4R18_002776 [Coemansia javaensis]|uniref:Uncharacterized protein n=1 Tax=Coemansia javaensis TaxID=2761396 RepID=A0A9W8LIN5_9FUNG|nr:hypothetical protein H4R18_002776 [Coemansia javaensis]